PRHLVEGAEGTKAPGEEVNAQRLGQLLELAQVGYQHAPAGLGRDQRRPRQLDLTARLEGDALLTPSQRDDVTVLAFGHEAALLETLQQRGDAARAFVSDRRAVRVDTDFLLLHAHAPLGARF